VGTLAGQKQDRLASICQLFLTLGFMDIADQKGKGNDAAGG
jgi:hypothetical protein